MKLNSLKSCRGLLMASDTRPHLDIMIWFALSSRFCNITIFITGLQ